MTKGKRDTLVQLGHDCHAALAAADQVKPNAGLPKIIRQTTAVVGKAWFRLDKHKNNETVEQLVSTKLVNGVKAATSRGSKYSVWRSTCLTEQRYLQA